MSIDLGYECPTPGVLCNKICGNGVQNGAEECDDGNPTPNDGCTNCRINKGWNCPTWGSNW